MYVTVYYNDVNLDPAIVRVNCPSIKAPIEDARRIAENMVAQGNWVKYLIPELEPFETKIE
jgi:hypothetical protein